MEIDRRVFIASLGGTTAVSLMSDEAKADALEEFMSARLNEVAAQRRRRRTRRPPRRFRPAAELEAQIETRPTRRGVGNLFVARSGNVKRLDKMPAKPRLVDFFTMRFNNTSNHCLQSATKALRSGMSEEVVLACLLHDVVQEIIKVDHGWWGAQLFEPYISEKTTFAIRYHQALRFYADPANGYEYPDLYRRVFGHDYRPEPYIEATYQMVRKHKMVRRGADGHGERPLRLRPQRAGESRAVRGHHRPELQAAEGRPRLRQQPGRAHVAHDRATRRAALIRGHRAKGKAALPCVIFAPMFKPAGP